MDKEVMAEHLISEASTKVGKVTESRSGSEWVSFERGFSIEKLANGECGIRLYLPITEAQYKKATNGSR